MQIEKYDCRADACIRRALMTTARFVLNAQSGFLPGGSMLPPYMSFIKILPALPLCAAVYGAALEIAPNQAGTRVRFTMDNRLQLLGKADDAVGFVKAHAQMKPQAV